VTFIVSRDLVLPANLIGLTIAQCGEVDRPSEVEVGLQYETRQVQELVDSSNLLFSVLFPTHWNCEHA